MSTKNVGGGPPGWRADDPWDDLWENQGTATPLTIGSLLAALSEAIDKAPGARDLPFAVEVYEKTGARRSLLVSGISFTGAGDRPDGVTMTVVPTSE